MILTRPVEVSAGTYAKLADLALSLAKDTRHKEVDIAFVIDAMTDHIIEDRTLSRIKRRLKAKARP